MMPFIPKYIDLPKEADVIIIGSGIMGCATAYYLAKKGIKALVLDKGLIGAKQSSKAWGFVRQQGREEPEIPLMQSGIKLWETLEQELGVDLNWKQKGCLYTATDHHQIQSYERWHDLAKFKYGLDTKLLTAKEINNLVPNWKYPTLGGLFTSNDGQAEPRIVSAAFAAKATDLGAMFVEGCEVSAIEKAGNKITGVLIDSHFIKSSIVLCASGTNSYRLLKPLGLSIPQQMVRGNGMRTNSQPIITDVTICGNGLGFRQKDDGTINVGDGVKVDVDITLGHLRALQWYLPNLWSHRDVFNFHFNKVSIEDLKHRLKFNNKNTLFKESNLNFTDVKKSEFNILKKLDQLSPLLKNVKIVESWSEQIDVLPDGIPIIDNLSTLNGLLVTTGFCGHGFALGPIVGKKIAEIIHKGKTDIDLSSFQLNRFTSGKVRKPNSFV